MMRSLWTASSGMYSQQLAVDTIANNIANVNTTAFKKERIEFQSLLYQTMQAAGQNPEVVGNRPANLQVGHGVRPVASSRNFNMGTLEPTGNNTDFAINGNGFFTIERGPGDTVFTRDGSFKLSPIGGGNLRLVTNDGFPVLDDQGNNIDFGEAINLDSLAISREGDFTIRGPEGETIGLGIRLGIAQFSNRQGLEALGNNLFGQTAASGVPILETVGAVGTISNVIQSHLERSNVQIAEEMVSLIVSQRGFELNSRIIQTSDEMLQQASNMRR